MCRGLILFMQRGFFNSVYCRDPAPVPDHLKSGYDSFILVRILEISKTDICSLLNTFGGIADHMR